MAGINFIEGGEFTPPLKFRNECYLTEIILLYQIYSISLYYKKQVIKTAKQIIKKFNPKAVKFDGNIEMPILF